MLQTGVTERSGTCDSASSAGGCRVSFLRLSFLSLIHWHSLNLNFVPSLRLHDGQAGGGRGTGTGKQTGGGRNIAQAGRAGQGVRVS